MSKPLGKSEILYLQRTCACCGLYSGPLDGSWSDAVEDAEAELQKARLSLRDELGTFDPRTERNIATLMPTAQRLARRFMKVAQDFPQTVRIISGSRTYAEQDALYALGRTIPHTKKVTNAEGGKSNHNFGAAWDVGIFAAGGRYLTGDEPGDDEAYEALAALIKGRIADIEWGGDWHSFIDRPHYQLPTGHDVDVIRHRFEAGEPLVA